MRLNSTTPGANRVGVEGAFDAAYARHHRHVWGLCYRMTGSAADADDLAQDTFERLVTRPPADLDRPLGPWLVRVAMNLSRDRLRRRRRKKYGGDWLPAPIEAIDEQPPAERIERADTEARYDLMESVSMAFLVALEALRPTARAVLLLRDVFDYSVKETAAALGTSEANVKTTLHRARKQMADYDAAPPTGSVEAGQAAMMALFERLVAGDVAGIEALLADDVVARADGGDRYRASRRPVIGAERVARYIAGLASKRGLPQWFEPRVLNGAAGFVAGFEEKEGHAPFLAMTFDVDASGAIVRMFSQLVDEKLSGVDLTPR